MANALPDSVLLPYQKAWIEDDSELKIAEKSRRTGLTWGEAADAVLTASASKSAGGTNHFYVGSNKEMAIEFIDACAMWARAFDKAASTIQEEVLKDEDKDILTFNIHFASGFKIQALSSRPSNLRGRQGNVTIDEAAFHAELAEVLKSLIPGLEITEETTPKDETRPERGGLDITKAKNLLKFEPTIQIEEGLRRFVTK
mgnify:CR=1 FL=1